MTYGGSKVRDGSALMVVLASAGALAMAHAGCGGSDTNTSPAGGGGNGAGGSNTSYVPTPSGGTGGTGGSGAGTTSTSTIETGGSSSGGSGGTGGAGTGGTSTTGHGGFGGGAWPDCTTQPSGSATKTIPQIWTDNPSMPEELWLPNVYVTAVSGQGCVDGTACQIFLQQDPGYATLAEAEKHGIKLFASKRTSKHFVGVAVGDKINVFGQAWRSDLNGTNELMIEVTLANPGCFANVSTANALTGVPLTKLEDLVKENYEAVGPLFVDVTSTPKIHGKPKTPAETFGIIDSSLDLEGGTDQLVSLSPTFLTGAVFTGLTTGTTTHFDHVTGVYGLFVPPNQMPPVTKYKEVYVRATADYPHD